MYFLFLKTLCLLRIQAFIKLLHILSETFACLFENTPSHFEIQYCTNSLL